MFVLVAVAFAALVLVALWFGVARATRRPTCELYIDTVKLPRADVLRALGSEPTVVRDASPMLAALRATPPPVPPEALKASAKRSPASFTRPA
jgi:hypothetical protein